MKSIWNWFSNNYSGKLPEPVKFISMPKVKSTKPNVVNDGYSVGVNEDGNAMLKISVDDTTATLTLTPAGVRQMIRLLTATLIQEE